MDTEGLHQIERIYKRRLAMEINTKEYETAKNFSVLVQEYEKKVNAAITNGDEKPQELIPMIVNLVFTCELYMKSLIRNYPKKHYLDKLFYLLSEKQQSYIKDATVESMKKWESNYGDSDFKEDLVAHTDAFTEWRYYFSDEKELHFKNNFMYCLCMALEGYIMSNK